MNDFNELIAGSKPVLVDFFATWCGPCKMMAPILEDVKDKIGDKATVIKIDVDKSQELSIQYGVQSVPTLIIFKNGEIVWREAGVHQASDIVAILEKHL